MSAWGDGYVTDLEYNDGFYPLQAPASIALAATLNGIEAPEVTVPFTYCELGCGRGDTSLILAALNPESEFHAVDFHPAHIAHARSRARAARLDNLSFHELNFSDLVGPRAPPLPMFDFVSLHGVWSWISPMLQGAIVDFLGARVKPGGLVHVTYNALPGWTEHAPLQWLMSELAAGSRGRSDAAVEAAIETLARLAEGKAIPARFRAHVETLSGLAKTSSLSYLAHEYLNTHWRPLYHADVARALSAAKLVFAACAEPLKNFNAIALTEGQRGLLSGIEPPDLRETLRDFCTDERFRQDVYVRGARIMSPARREAIMRDLQLTLIRHPPPIVQISRPDGSLWRPDPQVYAAVLAELARGPRRVAGLLSLPGLPAGHGVSAVELVGILVGIGLASPYATPAPSALDAADRLNDLAEADRDRTLRRGATIAVPAIGLGVPLTALHYPLYQTLRGGERPDAHALAVAFVDRCHEFGAHPVIDGKTIEDEDEALAAVADTYREYIEKVVPIWQMMAMGSR